MARTQDEALRERAARVIPGGMYGHQSASGLPPEAPQFFSRAKGGHLWDADGRRFVDFMCAYGPNLFGYGHESIDAAYLRQLGEIDCATGPSPIMVELAEAYAAQIGHCDWAVFCKNGTDATSMARRAARAHRGAKTVLVAKGAYHGAADWNTPRPSGTLPEDRAYMATYTYNDADSLRAAAEAAGSDLAGVFASPFKHDVIVPQEAPDPAYARACREVCDAADALLIVDEVRAGFRLARGSSWQALGVEPDLSAWGKALANGHALSALFGNDRAREAAASLYATGSFWFAAAPMAAALEALRLIRETDYLEHTVRLGTRLREGLGGLAREAGVSLSQTGPVQMPLITVSDADGKHDMAASQAWAGAMMARGVYMHPWHNMFIGAAMTEADIDLTLEAARAALASLGRGAAAPGGRR